MARERWEGGYIHLTKDGRKLHIIEREVGGVRYHVSTRCYSRRAAIAQFDRFQANPAGYQPGGEAPEAPIYLTVERALALWDWQVSTKSCTKKHANATKNYLAAWMEDLGKIDIRKVTLGDHVIPALKRRRTCRAHRIAALKVFYSWMREVEHQITSAQDPMLDLMVPQAVPEKRKRKKAVSLDRVQAAVERLEGRYQDMLVLAAATGWHVTEIERFIRRPESEIVMPHRQDPELAVPGEKGKPVVLAVLVTPHKVGELTRTPILDPQVLAAAERLREHGTMPKRPNDRLREACEAAAVEPFTFGVMRHTVGTWGVERGALPGAVSEFLNHRDPRTSKRFYIDVSVPTATVPLPKLNLKLVKAAN